MTHLPSPRLLASAMAGQFLFGITLALFGTLFGIGPFTSALGLDLDRQARLLVTFFAGQLLFTAVAGRLVDRFGSVHVLAAGAAALTVALGLAGTAGGMRALILAATVMSLGGAAINASSNVLVSTAYGDERGPMLNLLALFGALGAVAVPIVFAGTGNLRDVRVRLAVLAAAGALSAGAHLLQREPPASARVGPRARGTTRAILGDRWIVALTVLLGLDFGMESIAAGWMAAYTLSEVPDGPGTAMVGIYWIALMAGRLLGPVLLARVGKVPLIASAGVVVAFAYAGVTVAPTAVSLAVAVAIVGLALGPLGPTILSVAGDRYKRGTGAVFGVMLSLGQIGSVLLPWSVAKVAGAAGFRAAMLVPVVAAVLLAAVAASCWARRGATGYLAPAGWEAP